MKALTIRQPWAELVARGVKPVENRGWRPRSVQVGEDLAVHAGLALDWSWLDNPLQRPVVRAGMGRPLELLETGEVVAVVRLAGWHRPRMVGTLFGSEPCCQPWGYVAGWHWELADARMLDGSGLGCSGAQSLWDLPADVEAAVLEQLAVPA